MISAYLFTLDQNHKTKDVKGLYNNNNIDAILASNRSYFKPHLGTDD